MNKQSKVVGSTFRFPLIETIFVVTTASISNTMYILVDKDLGLLSYRTMAVCVFTVKLFALVVIKNQWKCEKYLPKCILFLWVKNECYYAILSAGRMFLIDIKQIYSICPLNDVVMKLP